MHICCEAPCSAAAPVPSTRSFFSPVLLRKGTRSYVPSAILLLLLYLVALGAMRMRVCASSFDIREHLSTKAPYIHRVRINGAPSIYETPDPPGYTPVFMYLLARHGSRWPTEKRMRQINSLKHLFNLVDQPNHPWMRNWTSPVAHLHYLAGDLHPMGEAEMLDLARRLRKRFPNLTADTYAPRRYPIISTQVPRAAQSASAFALGFFSHSAHIIKHQQQEQQQQHTDSSSSSSSSSSNVGSSTGWLPQPVAISMLPKRHDPVLRFFESCKAYREHEDRALRWLAPWMHRHWKTIIPGLEQRLGVKHGSLNACHVDALWQLCTFEAGLGLDSFTTTTSSSSSTRYSGKGATTSSSGSSSSIVCQLFTQADAQLLEWLEDVRLYETQGYGAPVNYEIAAPLLADIASALVSAAAADASRRQPLQRARLMFAHCETLTPLASLLGLFKPQQEEVAAMPQLPEERVLQEAVGTSSGVVGKELAAADGVDDLPLVMLADSAAEADATQQQQTTQQRAQQPETTQQNKRRRRLPHHTSRSDSSGNSGTDKFELFTAEQQQQKQQEQKHQPMRHHHHHHGPELEGCSYKGNEPMDISMLLPPPEGWTPEFESGDSDRVWRGGRVAPLGANLLLVLYSRTNRDSSSTSSDRASPEGLAGLHFGDFRVRLVYNEQVIPVPGCGSGLDWDLDRFLRVVVGDKTSRERFKHYCSSQQLQLSTAPEATAALGFRSQNILYGTGRSSSSDGTSSTSSSSSSEWVWLGESEQRDTESDMELVTADGLPLLLPATAAGSSQAVFAGGHRLWYH